MNQSKQNGSILFVVVMILVLMSMLVVMGVRSARNNMSIGISQAQQVAAFDQAEAMLSRIRFALEQIPTPPSIALDSAANNVDNIIWVTKEMVEEKAGLNPSNNRNIAEPLYAQPDFAWDSDKALTCKDLASWLKNNSSGVDLRCDDVFAKEKARQPRFFIEFITKSQTVDDIDSMRGAYFYRITILGRGFSSGRSIVQGVTGVLYI